MRFTIKGVRFRIGLFPIAALIAGYQLWGWWGVAWTLGVLPYIKESN